MVLRTKVDEFELEVRIVDVSNIENAYLSLSDARRQLQVKKKHNMQGMETKHRGVILHFRILENN